MAQCLECGIMIGEPGTYTTCRECHRAGRSPEARRRATGLSPERVGQAPVFHAEQIRVFDISVVPAKSVPVELRFSVKKNRTLPVKTVPTPFKTRFERDDVI
jgi:hypothetical protein